MSPGSLERRTLPFLALFALALPALAQDTGTPSGDGTQDDTPAPPQRPARPSGGAPPSDDAFEMGSPPQLAQGLTEEDMWPAASAEGWKKPVLVHWQRTFDDAMKVARAENRPILVCVNMDGEIASEHWAGVRYRQPETAEQMSRYVCVIASVYRHTPRDYDEEGRRVECPRFETVTCGEHIQAERDLYDQYFEGTRVSPRHIVLDLEGKETYDVYYSWDTATVFTTFRKGLEGWPEPTEPIEPTLFDMVQSADVEQREAVEAAYAEGDRETRRAILRQLIEKREVDQVEVLRAAIFGLDLELASLARRALSECDTEGALDLMAEALKTPLDGEERAMLLEAVDRLARQSQRAATLAALHSGLSTRSRHIEARTDADLAREYEANSGLRVDVQARADAAAARPNEPGALLDLATALASRAEEEPNERFARLMWRDAQEALADAERLGASGPRLDGVAAVVASALGQYRDARDRAVAAVEGGLLLAGDAPAGEIEGLSEASRVRLLRLFAEARQRSVRQAYRDGDTWPPEWLSDIKAAYATIAEHPLVDEGALADYHDFLRWIGATPLANEVLDDALARFPDSGLLHERLRARLLWDEEPDGLERAYAKRLEEEAAAGGEPTQLTWFAGYASLVAAEHYRRRGRFEDALAAYDRGIDYYRTSEAQFPEGADGCRHFVALAHAGRARVILEQGDLPGATDELLAALRTRPDSAATPDGLNITPIATAKMVQARLLDAGDGTRAEAIEAALNALDPRLLEPPPTEPADLGRDRLRRRPARGGDAGTAGGR